MEVVLIHKTVGVLPPDMMKTGAEMGKQICTNPGQFVPNGKLTSSVAALNSYTVICLWEVPSLDALLPVMEGMKNAGWVTDIIPVEQSLVWISKLEKALTK